MRYFRKNTLHIIEKPLVCQSFRQHPSEKGDFSLRKTSVSFKKLTGGCFIYIMDKKFNTRARRKNDRYSGMRRKHLSRKRHETGLGTAEEPYFVEQTVREGQPSRHFLLGKLPTGRIRHRGRRGLFRSAGIGQRLLHERDSFQDT